MYGAAVWVCPHTRVARVFVLGCVTRWASRSASHVLLAIAAIARPSELLSMALCRGAFERAGCCSHMRCAVAALHPGSPLPTPTACAARACCWLSLVAVDCWIVDRWWVVIVMSHGVNTM